MLAFGFGISYTTWTYGISEESTASPVSLVALPKLLGRSVAGFVRGADSKAAGTATNFTVSVDADNVVLGYLTPPNASTDSAPLKTLFGLSVYN